MTASEAKKILEIKKGSQHRKSHAQGFLEGFAVAEKMAELLRVRLEHKQHPARCWTLSFFKRECGDCSVCTINKVFALYDQYRGEE